MQEKIVERMFRIIDEKNLKSVKLAELLGISQGVVSNWKKRGTNPPVEYTIVICEFLNVSLEFYLTGNDVIEGHLSREEEKLLESFRQCNTEMKISIINIASAGAVASETVATGEKTDDGNLYSSKTG